VLQPDRADVGLRPAEVAIDEAVEIVAVAAVIGTHDAHAGRQVRRTVEVRDARIGHVVRIEVVEAEGRRSRTVEAERERRREAEAAARHFVATGDAGIVAHQRDAECRVFADAVVRVDRGALVVGRAGAERDFGEVLRDRQLADEIDAAAAVGAAAVDRVRALDDFDAVDRERLARLRAGIAHAVDEGGVLRVVAAQERTIALRIAALARAEGDAGHGTQRVGEVVAPISLMSCAGTTLTWRGVSSSGAVNFGDEACLTALLWTVMPSSSVVLPASASGVDDAASASGFALSPLSGAANAAGAVETSAVPSAVASRRTGLPWRAVMKAVDGIWNSWHFDREKPRTRGLGGRAAAHECVAFPAILAIWTTAAIRKYYF
jgi:hypothetical protein